MASELQFEIIGILNVTPDSFSDGGNFFTASAAIQQAKQLFADGAAIVDVGAESTNPWSSPLSAAEEWSRLENVLPQLVKQFPGKLSLDTYHPETATKALQIDPTIIINDVTMFRNPKLVAVVAQHKAQCIVSHLSPDSPTIADAHANPRTRSVDQVRSELLATYNLLVEHGVPAEQIILDPGIGFGKTMELNRQLLGFAQEMPEHHVLIGYSRKRFLGENRMDTAPNLAAGKIAKQAGARYIRVHDVAAHRQLLD